jgi:glycosyltransferase 2 family protein
MPSGLGLVLLNTYYLKRYGHSNTETASVISMSALTSALAFTSIIIIGLVVGRGSDVVREADITIPHWVPFAAVIACSILALIVWQSPAIRAKLKKPFQDIVRQLSGYRHRPHDVGIAITGNGLATMTSVVTLFACAQGLGTPISLTLALITYVLGNTLGGLVPTPGGLGGVEAGLYAGLVLGGVEGSAALSIVLLYRLITYWIALIPGITFFILLRKDVLSDFSFSNK